MKTHPILAAAMMAGLLSAAFAQEAAPGETAAPAAGATGAPVLAPESAEAAESGTGATSATSAPPTTETKAPAAAESSAPNAEEESAPVPEKIDPAAILQENDEPLPLLPDSTVHGKESDVNFLSNIPESPDAVNSGPLKKGTAEQLRQAIRIRELKTVALKDPAIIAERQKAEAALTYEGRRVAMRNYYTMLHAKIVSLDASLKEVLEIELRKKLSSLEQHRVRPSKLIEPIKEVAGSRSTDYAEKSE
jgi:hypothetical protein